MSCVVFGNGLELLYCESITAYCCDRNFVSN